MMEYVDVRLSLNYSVRVGIYTNTYGEQLAYATEEWPPPIKHEIEEEL